MFKLSYRHLLWQVILLAFLLRLAGVGYGLPLWLAGDEPPFVTATLKMIELKTVLPVLHQEEFKPTLYFPPYLAYLYIIPFTILLGVKYLLFSGTIPEFENFLLSDLSHFFILARIINVILGTLTVWLVYKISKNIFKKELPAIFSACFLAFSTLHAYLSFVARDWVPAVFLFSLAMWIISHPKYSFKKRYLAGALISGVGFGVSLIAGFIMLFMLFWYIFYEKNSIISVFKNKILYGALFIFLALSAMSIAVYPFGFHLSGDNTLAKNKTIAEFALSIINFLKPILISEPMLILFGIAGLFFSYKKARNYFWTATVFLFSYMSIFYLVFFYGQRYTIYLFPVIAILAGYGLYMSVSFAPKKFWGLIFVLVFFVPLSTAVKLDWLTIKDDSRMQARNWIEENIPDNTKILVYAEMTRIASTREAIGEQSSIDPASLRKIDKAEAFFRQNRHGYTNFHALNLYSVNNDEFFKNIETYARENKYEYLLIDPFYPPLKPRGQEEFTSLVEKGELLKKFGSPQKKHCLRDGNFGNVFGFWKLKEPGPQVEIYKLQYD